jgi:hypothetical protein
MNKEYVKYLNSETWKNTKNLFYKSKYNKNKCYICEKKDVPFDLHHKTYERVGCERLTDLVQVCRPCHKSIHLILDHCKNNEFTLWNVAKKCKTLFKKQGKKAFINIIPTTKKPLPAPKKKNNKKVSLREYVENTPIITLTSRIMRLGKSCKNGLSMKQLRILGVTKEKKGWKKQILGKEFPQHVIKQFLDFKNEHIDWEKEKFNKSKKKKSKKKTLQLHEKAYNRLCNFEKNSEKTVKLRKKTKTLQ